MLDPWPVCPYTLLVSRRWSAPYCRVWRGWSLKPLPVIPVPLVKPDADFALALQPLIEAICVRSRYHRSIDYTKPLSTLSEEETAFLAQQLRGRSS